MKIKTLLIGLDGATFTVLDPLMESGVMPFLRSFLAEGVRAPLRTIVPALTPPAWTSVVTGRTPGQHGVFDFFRLQDRNNWHIRFFTSHDIGCETIWSIAAGSGMRVNSLNFPGMFPPPRIAGNIIPGWVPWRQLRLACWPEDLFDRLKRTVVTFTPRELAMDISLEEKATEGCSDHAEYAPWIRLHTRREENWFDIYRSLTERDPAPLTAVLFDGVDKLQHLCWRFLRPEDDSPLTEPWELEARELCLEYFRKLDGLLEKMCRQAGTETTVIIVSDHGFQPSRSVFHVNAWLAERGYLKWSETALNQQSKAVLGVGQVARHTWLLDWSGTTAFAATPTSNGIYLVVNRDGNSPGIPPDQYEGLRARLTDELRSFRHPDTGQPMVTSVCTREEIFAGPHSDLAPDLTLGLFDGGLVSILPSEHLVSNRPSAAGVHAPLGVFAAKGPGVRHGFEASEISLLDVAPLVLHTLGLGVPHEMQGDVPANVFEPGALAVNPPRRVQTRKSPVAIAASAEERKPALSAEDEQIVLDRLRQLGYLE
jgi:predicted AlkP superfamily phosphohydrolase/phosphomutase